MDSLEIRKKFFDFFVKNGHEKVVSSPLIPAQDPTLLFTNAGMNQFKDLFLGKETRSYKRAVTIQKCMRAGGKHNDLDNVGFTKRHLTFFEMMGNFSFGDYFKKEAIRFAWDFITQEVKLPEEKLHVTVYKKDDEAYNLWHKAIGIPQERITRLGEADNFWQMGDVGPCGPCTEIYIDRGVNFGCGKNECAPGCSCDRFLEFWNLVFMQYDRQSDGELKPLKQTGVDTGMGLERLCAIVQDKDSVFEVDLFAPIIKKIEELTGLVYKEQDQPQKAAFHVLADHIRSSTFLIADGCSPSNEGRGYVLRKIIRRAALFEQKLTSKSIFPDLVHAVIEKMGDIYPELRVNEKLIRNVIKIEVDKFAANLVRGLAILQDYIAETGSLRAESLPVHQSYDKGRIEGYEHKKIISGKQAFKLYDTFGFPLEVVQLVAQEQGFTVDTKEFEAEMQKQREQSGKKVTAEITVSLDPAIKTEFTGYQETHNESEIITLIQDNKVVAEVSVGDDVWIITKKSPFFVEYGGQISDQGYIEHKDVRTELKALKKIDSAIAAKITAPISLKVGDVIVSQVDVEHRINIMKNHTATHLLQAALIELLGKQVKQSGSIVTPDYLRFDFTYHENLTTEQIKWVEDKVNQKIRENIAVNISITSYKQAIDKGVIAIFGEKYNPESVRIVDVPGFSAELCGGTHVQRTGDIGVFKITEISALSAGNRRIVALTGSKAIELYQKLFNDIKQLSQDFKVKPEEVVYVIEKQKGTIKDLHATISHLKKQIITLQMPIWLAGIKIINKIPYLAAEIPGAENTDLKLIAEQLLAKQAGLYVLLGTHDTKTNFIVVLAPTLAKEIDLKELSKVFAEQHHLRGGGSATAIQGGGTTVNIHKLEETIKEFLV